MELKDKSVNLDSKIDTAAPLKPRVPLDTSAPSERGSLKPSVAAALSAALLAACGGGGGGEGGAGAGAPVGAGGSDPGTGTGQATPPPTKIGRAHV